MYRTITLAVLIPVGALTGQTDDPDQLPAVMRQLHVACADVTTRDIGTAAFPLARYSAIQASCTMAGASKPSIHVTFADSVRVLTAHLGGDAVSALIAGADGEAMEYGPFRIWPGTDPVLVVASNDSIAWTGAMPSVMAHPFLIPVAHGAEVYSGPPIDINSLGLTLGRDIGEVEQEMKERCAYSTTRVIDEVWLPGVTEQRQVECLGIMWGGVPRKLEIVFGDGKLALSWLFSTYQEVDRLRVMLTEQVGPRIDSLAGYEVYGDGSVAIRHEPPEVLIASPEVVKRYTTPEP